MKYSEQHIQSELANAARTILPANAKLILFGSHARNEATEESDWDLLSLMDKENITDSDYDKYVWPLVTLGWNLGEYFSVKMYSADNWRKRSGTPFYKNVEREGVEI